MTIDQPPHVSHLEPEGLPPAPAPAPRELTAAVLRQSWGEKHVRIWGLLAMVMAIIASYYAASRAYYWNRERQLITHGQKVKAKVMGWEPGGDVPPDKKYPILAGTSVDIQYTHAGKTYRPHRELVGLKDVTTNQLIDIYIDPADPTRWTERLEPRSFAQELISAILIVPFVIAFAVFAMFSRRRVLRIYRDGEAVLSQVVGIGHAAAAPGSRMIRCVIHQGNDDRIIKVVLPIAKAPAVGEGLWLIAPPGRPLEGIPAVLFES